MWGEAEWSDSECSSVECAEEKSNVSYQTGRVEVGGKPEDNEDESVRFHVDFNNPFNETPVVFLCPEGEGDYADVFATTVIEETVSPDGFDFNVGRMSKGDCSGWGQNLAMNWLAVSSNSPLMQTMIIEAGPKEDEGEESLRCEGRFPQPFPKGYPYRPSLICQAYGADYPDTFACCIRRSGQKKVHLNVCRTNGGGWGQEVKIAVLGTYMFPMTRVEIGPNEDEETRDCTIGGLNYPLPCARTPTIFTTIRHEGRSDYGDAFTCSPCSINNEGFQLNFQRGNRECNSWGQNLTCEVTLIP